MGIVYPQRGRGPRHASVGRRILLGLCVLVGLFVLANGVVWAMFHHRTYPHTLVATVPVGNMTYEAAAQKALEDKAWPTTITVAHGSQTATVTLADLGAEPDATRVTASAAAARSWLPLANLFTTHHVAVPIRLQTAAVTSFASKIAGMFHATPVNAKVVLHGGEFSVLPASDGYDLDRQKLAAAILQGIDAGRATIATPLVTISANASQAIAQAAAAALQKSLGANVSFTFGAQTRRPTGSDIASWYVPSGDSYAVDDFALRTYIEKAGIAMGVRPNNLSAAVASAKAALASGKAQTIVLTPFTAFKNLTYCVNARGVSDSYLDGLKVKLASVYADLRGWNLDGQVVFNYGTANCDFTVWMSSPAQMTSFGAVCDSYWNCDVGQNVIINVDRWNSTSDAWKQYGGSLEDYHTMAINHETGHMLGFGHNTCPAPGALAPVMMQESIDLQGCVFNIWPLQSERDVLRQKLQL